MENIRHTYIPRLHTRARLKLQRLWWRVKGRWPWMRKSISLKRIRETRAEVLCTSRLEREADLEVIAEIAGRIVSPDWSRAERGYRLTLLVNPEMLAPYSDDRRAREIMAEFVGRQVASEIRSSRFIEVAHEDERRRSR